MGSTVSSRRSPFGSVPHETVVGHTAAPQSLSLDNMMLPRDTVLAIALLVCVSTTFVQAVNFNVEAGRKDCFWDEQTEHMPISGSFQVTAGGFLDIDVTIYEPDDRLIFEATRESEGKFAYVSSTSGLFKFCFSNEMSTMTSKSVNFQITHGHEINSPAKARHLNAIETSIVKLSDQGASLMAELKYFRARERANRNSKFVDRFFPYIFFVPNLIVCAIMMMILRIVFGSLGSPGFGC